MAGDQSAHFGPTDDLTWVSRVVGALLTQGALIEYGSARNSQRRREAGKAAPSCQRSSTGIA